MNSGYFPVVVNPYKLRAQTKSEELQTPFYFGGSQVPEALSMKKSGMKGSGINETDAAKRGSKIFHNDGKLVKMFGREAFKKSGIY